MFEVVNSPVFSITPDGRCVILGAEHQTLQVWDLYNGKCLAIYQINGYVTAISQIHANGNVVCGTATGAIILMATHNLLLGVPIVTPFRLWLYGMNDKPTTNRLLRLFTIENKGYKGCWDNNISTLCQWCGKRFSVAATVLDVIRGITRAANLTPDQSPCLELPDEAWDEPRLLSECPLCHQPLKFNPFVVDNRERFQTDPYLSQSDLFLLRLFRRMELIKRNRLL